jgi:TRAP-type mannitol/chloroaromatic compound transport system permease small subunit
MTDAAPAAVRRIEAFIDATGRLTLYLTLAMIGLVAVNVLLRYAFSFGSVWAQELEWHLLVPLILFGASYALRHGEHVRVDIVYGRFSQRNKDLVDFVSAILAMAIAALFIWYSVFYVQQSWVIDEGSPDPGGIPHRFLLKALIPIGFALLLAQSFASALNSWHKLRAR